MSPKLLTWLNLLPLDYCCCQNKELNIIVFDSMYLAKLFCIKEMPMLGFFQSDVLRTSCDFFGIKI
jgi:hypothetical protein